jgi:glycosyltransferase involved in cell wall biosynthesis
VTTIVIPAHNEGTVIGRLLGQLVPDALSSELNVLVVANGCTDDTARVAASFGPSVRVLSIPVASKYEALAAADREAGEFPRIYVDADVELGTQDVKDLVTALDEPGVLAAAP